MNTTLDYTKLRLNKKARIVKCPDCGKHGELHKYTDGSAMIACSATSLTSMRKYRP